MNSDDEEDGEGPPKPGNVLNKMLLFSSIEAKAMETPVLVRRQSADANKLVRNFSSASLASSTGKNFVSCKRKV